MAYPATWQSHRCAFTRVYICRVPDTSCGTWCSCAGQCLATVAHTTACVCRCLRSCVRMQAPPPTSPSPDIQSPLNLRRAPQEIVMRSAPPPGFFCPLTGILMRDPVLLRDSGISYERNALEWALHREPGLCPVSGLVLTDQTVYEDADLRRRIESWAQVNRPELVVRTYTVHLKVFTITLV